MLRVTVELLPYGRKDRATVLKQYHIVNSNDSVDSPRLGNYDVYDETECWDIGRVENWERSRSLEYLVLEALKSVVERDGKIDPDMDLLY